MYDYTSVIIKKKYLDERTETSSAVRQVVRKEVAFLGGRDTPENLKR